MPIFTVKDTLRPDFLENASILIQFSSICDGFIFPEDASDSWRMIWLEKIYQTMKRSGHDLSVLDRFDDYCELIKERRPDPTMEQWLWLYANIGHRHPNRSFDEVCQIMCGRDAFLPFLYMVPDKRFRDERNRINGTWDTDEKYEPAELPYPDLESIIQKDDTSRFKLTRLLCRNVSNEQILKRAMELEKPKMVCTLISALSMEERLKILIRAIDKWQDTPVQLLTCLLDNWSNEIRQWRDPWGNALFWYLYYREPASRELFEALHNVLPELYEVKNVFGIAPCDVWTYYRPKVTFNSTSMY